MEQTPVTRNRQPDSRSGTSWPRGLRLELGREDNRPVLQNHLRIGRARHALQELRVEGDDLRVVGSVQEDLFGCDRLGGGHGTGAEDAKGRLLQVGGEIADGGKTNRFDQIARLQLRWSGG